MATYLLTTDNDTYTGTPSDDVFDGYPTGSTGGTDELNGGGGNDLFQIAWNSRGTIDGGAGIDTVELHGSELGATKYTRVEILSVVNGSWGVSGSIAQLRAFANIEFSGDNLVVRLDGARGALDFSTMLGAAQSVEVIGDSMDKGYTITGTANADTLSGTAYADVLNGGAGNDSIGGSSGADILNGEDGDDEIYTQGADIVDGGADNDQIYLRYFEGSASGGAGDDTFHLEDFVGSPINFDFNLDGGSGKDKLVIGRDLSNGTFSNIETLTTQEGRVLGTIAQINSFERVEHTSEESHLHFGLRGAGGVLDLSTLLASGQSANVYDIEMSGGYTVTGTANADTLQGTDFADILNGGAGNDYINGYGGANVLNGGSGNDAIYAQGSDIADGGSGHDTIYLEGFEGSASGGAGHDIFHLVYPGDDHFNIDGGAGRDRLITHGNLGKGTFSNIETLEIFSDSVDGSIEQLNAFARIECLLPYSRLTFELRGEVGALDFSAGFGAGSRSVYVYDSGMSGGYTVTGTTNGDSLFGTGYADVLNGGSGSDNISGEGGWDILNGGTGDDSIFGGEGNDIIDGGAGVDTMSGGLDDDTYYVDAAGDIVIEAVGRGIADRVIASTSYALTAGAEIEFLQTNSMTGTNGIRLTGNEFAQTLIGNAGNNVLNGMGGADTLRGRMGNDTYVVDNAGDVVIEAADQGTDRVITSVSYALSTNASIEQMQTSEAEATNALNLTGNKFAQTLIGNDGNNVLDGKGGADTLRGRIGDDTYIVDNAGDVIIEAADQGTDRVITNVSYALSTNASIEQIQTSDAEATKALNLTGNKFAQTLIGNDGNNILDGMGGADTLRGRLGNDTYIVDNAGDVIIEAAGQGTDRVLTSVSYALSTNASIEQMQTSDAEATKALNLTGNKYAQTLIGNAGNNVLDGMGGADTLRGRAGNDTYVVDNADDVVLEGTGQGTDKVITSVSYALSANAEVEQMKTSDAALTTSIDLTGSNTVQAIFGNAGANRLDGKGGADTLRGFGGPDTYVFSTKVTAANVDTIVGFKPAEDMIELDSDIFTGLTEGSFISENQFVANTSGVATTADHRVIYETDTGNLYFDANGSGAGGRLLFAVVSSNLALTDDDFFVG